MHDTAKSLDRLSLEAPNVSAFGDSKFSRSLGVPYFPSTPSALLTSQGAQFHEQVMTCQMR